MRRGRIVELRRNPRNCRRSDADRGRHDRWWKSELIGDLVQRNSVQPDHPPSGIMRRLDSRVVVRLRGMMRLEMPVNQRVPVVRLAFVHVLGRDRGPYREQRRKDEQRDNATW
jgi:hypothetical protein